METSNFSSYCSVCLEDKLEKSIIVTCKTCSRWTHQECISGMFRCECPLCRADLTDMVSKTVLDKIRKNKESFDNATLRSLIPTTSATAPLNVREVAYTVGCAAMVLWYNTQRDIENRTVNKVAILMVATQVGLQLNLDELTIGCCLAYMVRSFRG